MFEDSIQPREKKLSRLNDSTTRRYSMQGLWSLFLMCAFPLHLWAMILIFRDVSWVIERTNIWDAIGVGSYGMIRAFTESAIVFVIFALLGFCTPKPWSVDKRIAFLSLLVLLLSAWGMIGQLLFLWNVSLPASLMQFVIDSGHPLRMLYAMSLAVVLPTILLPMYLFIRSDKFIRFIQELIERLSLLTVFYLIFDAMGLIIVIVRNIS